MVVNVREALAKKTAKSFNCRQNKVQRDEDNERKSEKKERQSERG